MYLFLLPLIAASGPAPDSLLIPSRIDAVTVLRNHAMVVRHADLSLPALGAKTSHLVAIGGLPPQLDRQSVQAHCTGPSHPEIARLSLGLTGTAEDGREKVARLKEKISRLSSRYALASARSQNLNQLRALYLRRLGAGRKAIDIDRTIAQEMKLSKARHRVAERLEELTQRRSRLYQELARVRRGNRRESSSTRLPVVQVELLARNPGKAHCEIRYKVAGAGWHSTYDARLVRGRIRLTHNAWVTNRTGEPWRNVRLSVSTASGSSSTPTRRVRPVHLRLASLHQVGSRRPAWGRKLNRSLLANFGQFRRVGALALGIDPDARHASPSTLTVFRAPLRASIADNGEQSRVYLATQTLRPKLNYIALPRSSDTAYVTARVKNTSDLALLPGTARLFIGDEYVGNAAIPTVAPGNELWLSFGPDRRVRVARIHRSRVVKEIGNREIREVTDRFEVRLRNRTGRPIAVDVLDRVPVSTSSTIRVKLEAASRPPRELTGKRQRGVIYWRVKLPDRRSRNIGFGYSVESPIGREVVGL